MLPLKSSLLKCTTNSSNKVTLVTTSASTSSKASVNISYFLAYRYIGTSPSRIFVVETSPPTLRMTLLKRPLLSTPKLSSSTTPDRLVLVTLPSSIATPPILPANSLNSSRRSIAERVNRLKTRPSLSNLVMPASSNLFQASPWYVIKFIYFSSSY